MAFAEIAAHATCSLRFDWHQNDMFAMRLPAPRCAWPDNRSHWLCGGNVVRSIQGIDGEIARMQAMFGYSAAALAALWLLVHFIIGGREVARPLRMNTELPDIVRVTMWMCWHMVTACIALLALLPILALQTDLPGLMIAALLLAIAFSLAGIAAQFFLRVKLSLLPQGWLFVPVALLCALAL
ncbi:MAG: hypothetical protein AAGA08_16440 [Pseudomonadota bacterium]